jgi:hypothetical protein
MVPDRTDTVDASAVPQGVDHLVYAVPDLHAGIARIERLLKVQPVVGGRHTDFGTHNALVALGATTYLEIIAADPDLVRPGRGRVFGVDETATSRLVTWALRCDHLQVKVEQMAAAGHDLGNVQSGSRQRPDGEVLRWQLSDPYAYRLGGAIPFLIDWGATPHPAGKIPQAGELASLAIEHPEPMLVRRALQCLGVDLPVAKGSRAGIIARICTAAGNVTLR